MAKISDNYEVVYIVDPAVGEEAIAATVEKFKALQSSTAAPVWRWRSGASAASPTPSTIRLRDTMFS